MSIDITQNPVFLKDGKKITIEDFDIEIPEEEAEKLLSLKDIYSYIDSRTVKK